MRPESARGGTMIAVLIAVSVASAGPPEGTVDTARAPSQAEAKAAQARGAAPAEAHDARPGGPLQVLRTTKSADRVFPQVLEGRLISDLADMETFRTVGVDAPGDYLLTVTIRAVNVSQGTSMRETRD